MLVTSGGPSRVARRRPRIGVFIEWLTDGYVDPLLDEIAMMAQERNVDVLCFVGSLSEEDFHQPSRKPCALPRHDALDGVLLVTIGNTIAPEKVSDYMRRLDPLPMCSVAVFWEDRMQVRVDNETGLREGIRHLITTHKRRRIACVRGPHSNVEAEIRYRVYREVLQEAGLPFDEALVAVGMFIREHGTEAVQAWLDRGVSFDAVVAANDGMAMGVLQELNRRGIRVPEQVSLLGFDDTEEARFARPPFSTVKQPLRQHARVAFENLLKAMRGDAVPRVTTLPSELVLRRSCGCIASDGPAFSYRPSTSEPQAKTPEIVLAPLLAFCQSAAPQLAGLDQLIDGFGWLIEGGDQQGFLRSLEEMLDTIAHADRDVSRAFPMLRNVYQRARQAFDREPEVWARIERVLHAAGTLVGEVVERIQAVKRQQVEQHTYSLIRANEALQQCLSLADVQRILARALVSFDVPRCFLCVFEGAPAPLQAARLVLANDRRTPRELPAEGTLFAASDIVPFDLSLSDRPTLHMICPLLRNEEQIPGYVVFERGLPQGVVYDGLLDQLGSAYRRIALMRRVVEETRRREAAERERLEEEMLIAKRIQTGVLPRDVQLPELEFSALMIPASEVGGDYYDVIAGKRGSWISIGDVAGHGLPAGLVMLMLQSVLAGVVRQNPEGSPAALLPLVNQVLFENIRTRMRQDEFVTLTLLHYQGGGQFVFAGAHEDILIYRARERRVESVSTRGTWLAVTRDITKVLKDQTCQLEPADIMLLYTDGVTETMNEAREQFGIERVQRLLCELWGEPVERIRDGILNSVQNFMHKQNDDITLVVIRQL